MAEKGKVLSDCVYAANPFHECSENCLKKIADGKTRKDKKKSSSLILDVSRSFGRKKKQVSQPTSPQVNDNVLFGNTVDPYKYASKKKVEAENGKDFPHSQRHVRETRAQDISFNMGQVKSIQSVPTSEIDESIQSVPTSEIDESIQSVPTSEILAVPDLSKDPPKVNGTLISRETPDDQEEDEKLHALPYSVPKPIIGDLGEHAAASALSISFSFSGIADAIEGSDDEEIQSSFSDSCVSVGKYHVKESLASILQSIFDKFGDIAASCQLESNAIRAYYLECVCFVVKELQSTSVTQLTKSKAKELLAILKDIESSKIDISWLQGIINDMTEDVELINQRRSIEVAKANCDRDVESTRKELESQLEQVAETRARLSELELKSSLLNETMVSIMSKTENFQGRSLLSEL